MQKTHVRLGCVGVGAGKEPSCTVRSQKQDKKKKIRMPKCVCRMGNLIVDWTNMDFVCRIHLSAELIRRVVSPAPVCAHDLSAVVHWQVPLARNDERVLWGYPGRPPAVAASWSR